jgi:hypothetical protein
MKVTLNIKHFRKEDLAGKPTRDISCLGTLALPKHCSFPEGGRVVRAMVKREIWNTKVTDFLNSSIVRNNVCFIARKDFNEKFKSDTFDVSTLAQKCGAQCLILSVFGSSQFTGLPVIRIKVEDEENLKDLTIDELRFISVDIVKWDQETTSPSPVPALSYADVTGRRTNDSSKGCVTRSQRKADTTDNVNKSTDTIWFSVTETVNKLGKALWGESDEGRQIKAAIALVEACPSWSNEGPPYSTYEKVLGLVRKLSGESLFSFADAVFEKISDLDTLDILHFVVACAIFNSNYGVYARSKALSKYVFPALAKLAFTKVPFVLHDAGANSELLMDAMKIVGTFLLNLPGWIERTTNAPAVPNYAVTKLVWIQITHCDQSVDRASRSLSKVVRDPSEYIREEGGGLSDFLESVAYATMVFGLYTDYNMLVRDFDTVMPNHDTGILPLDRVVVNSVTAEWIKSFAKVPSNADACLDLLSRIDFYAENLALKTSLVKCMTDSRSSLQELNCLFISVDVRHPLFDHLQEVCGSRLVDELNVRQRRTHLDIPNVTRLFDLDVAKVLGSRDGIHAILRFVAHCAERHSNTKTQYMNKMQLLAVVYEKFVVEEWAMEPLIFARYVQDALRDVHVGFDLSVASVVSLFDFACASRGAFSCVSDSTTCTLMVGLLQTEKLGRQLMKQPKGVFDLMKKFDETDHPGDLISQLAEWLVKAVDSTRPTIKQTAELCQHLLANGKGEISHFTSNAAGTLMRGAYARWKPSTVEQLVVEEYVTIYLETLLELKDSRSIQQEISQVVSAWVERHDAGNLSLADYDTFLSCYDERKLELLSQLSGASIPLKPTIVEAANIFGRLAGSMQDLLVFEWDGQETPEGAFCKPRMEVSELLRRYNVLDPTAVDHALCGDGISSKTISLTKLQEAHQYLSDVWKTNELDLKVAAYFTENHSVIFDAAMIEGARSGSRDLSTFLNTVKVTHKKLGMLLTLEAPYAPLLASYSNMTSGGCDVMHELDRLSSCPYVKFCSSDFEHLCLVTSSIINLHSLRQFVDSSKQFQFRFVHDDGKFGKLENLVNGLEHPQAETLLKEVVEQARALQALFLEESSSSTLEKRLQDLYPIFSFFEVLSSCSDVWAFVRDNKWEGDAGWKAFCEEYSNITNVSLGESSFEMTVLDSLGPAVRSVSSAAGLHSSTDMREVFMLLEEKVIKQATDHRFEDLKTSQQNISRIKEWFTEGMDDTVALSNKFKAILETGLYSLRISDSVEEMDLSLMLCYKVEEQGRNELMLENDLVDFIRHLGFMQDESSASAKRSKLFMEEYKLLREAARNFNTLSLTGFHGTDIQLKYKAGQQSLNGANAILNDSRAQVAKCDEWLQRVRAKCPISLLFWTEELRKMHHVLQISAEARVEAAIGIGEVAVDSISSFLYRIDPNALDTNHRGHLESVLSSFLAISSQNQPWLESTSELLQDLHTALGNPRDSSSNQRCTVNSAIHTLNVEAEMRRSALPLLVEHIYKVRLAPRFMSSLYAQFFISP